jgi:hypothetical protein
MKSWAEKEWRIPRKGEVVRDLDGNLGWVVRSQGSLVERSVWINNENDVEIHTCVDSKNFTLVDVEENKKFHLRRHANKGFVIGALCSFKSDLNVPLKIVQLDWNAIRYCMTICLVDMRKFSSEILMTEDSNLLELFSQEFPKIENIFSTYDTGLRWRLDISLVEKDPPGWTNCGSPWEFYSREDAIAEYEIWKSRMKARRLASVINSDWKVSLPAWVVEVSDNNELRVHPVSTYNGSPAYFRTALHAATALGMLDLKDWKNCMGFTQDTLSL